MKSAALNLPPPSPEPNVPVTHFRYRLVIVAAVALFTIPVVALGQADIAVSTTGSTFIFDSKNATLNVQVRNLGPADATNIANTT